MEKEFVSYELAVKLKELGFDEPCMGYYHVNDGYTKGYAFCYFNNPKKIKDGFDLLAPIFSQAFRWFREKYGLFSNLDVIDNCATFYYEYQIVNHKDTEFYHDGHQARRLWNNLEFRTYEEAELECLKKLIEIVETKSK